jgi:type IV pilus assembly protein PilA
MRTVRTARKQRGFNFVELMMVVAVIGVLSIIVIPAYSDYTSRAKVMDAVSLLAGLKNPMMDYYITWGTWPSVDEVGGKATGTYTSIVISGKPNTYVEATMKMSAGADLGGKHIRIVYYPETRDWVCTTVGASNPIPDKLVPSSCK